LNNLGSKDYWIYYQLGVAWRALLWGWQCNIRLYETRQFFFFFQKEKSNVKKMCPSREFGVWTVLAWHFLAQSLHNSDARRRLSSQDKLALDLGRIYVDSKVATARGNLCTVAHWDFFD
jgi:hypothetical protein